MANNPGESWGNPFEESKNSPGGNPFEESKNSSEEAPSEEAPSWSDDKPDKTPLLATENEDSKKGHKLFGFCCDTRRAVMIVNILSLIMFFAGIIAAAVPGRVSMGAQSDVVMVFNIAFTFVIFYGAWKWSYMCVLIGLLWEVFILVFWIVSASSAVKNTDWSAEPAGAKSSTMAFVVLSILWQFVVIYAEVMFAWESKKGIMTPETYAREEQSIICV